jgi:hypothetical protein
MAGRPLGSGSEQLLLPPPLSFIAEAEAEETRQKTEKYVRASFFCFLIAHFQLLVGAA